MKFYFDHDKIVQVENYACPEYKVYYLSKIKIIPENT